MQGWIKLHRQIIFSDIYTMPPLYLRVFERLVLEANHAEKEIPYKGGKKLIKRGERLTSVQQICEWVAWYERGILKVPNKKTIAVILDWLIQNNMIEIFNKGNARETHYNVLNYSIYQITECNESNDQVTEKKRPLDTNKNAKNDKNEKKTTAPDFASIINAYTDDENLQTAIYDYIEHREALDNPIRTKKGMELVLKDLKTFSNPIAVINQSIANGWKGLFELTNKPAVQVEKSEPNNPAYLKIKQQMEGGKLASAK